MTSDSTSSGMPSLDGGLKRKIGERFPLLRAIKQAVIGHTTPYTLMHRPVLSTDGDWSETGLPRELLCRAGTDADIPAIGAIWPPEFDEGAPEKVAATLERRFKERIPCLVVCLHGQIVGVAWSSPRDGLLSTVDLPGGDSMIEVRNYFVAPAARGRGIGQIMWRWLLRDAFQRGIRHVYIISEHRPDRAPAVRVAAQVGFEAVGTIRVRNRFGRVTVSLDP